MLGAEVPPTHFEGHFLQHFCWQILLWLYVLGPVCQDFFHLKFRILCVQQGAWWRRMMLPIVMIWLEQADMKDIVHAPMARQP